MKKRVLNRLLSTLLIIGCLCVYSLQSFAWGNTISNNTSCYIRAVKSGMYIGADYSTTPSNGCAIKLKDGLFTNRCTEWIAYTNSSGWTYFKLSAYPNYYMAVNNSSTDNNTQLVLKYIQTGGTIPSNCYFRVSSIQDSTSTLGACRIETKTAYDVNLSKSIEAYGGYTSENTNIVQYASHTSSIDIGYNQFWIFEDTNVEEIALGSFDCIDSNGHCDYTVDSIYSEYVSQAVSIWNNAASQVIFRADTLLTIRDLKIIDKTVSATNPGVFAATFDSGKTEFYTSAMNAFSSDSARIKTVTHELGHAIGLDDNNAIKCNIMTQGQLVYRYSLSMKDKMSLVAKIY